MGLEVDLDELTTLLEVELKVRLGKLPIVRLEVEGVAEFPAS